jgi:hypothetical protein
MRGRGRSCRRGVGAVVATLALVAVSCGGHRSADPAAGDVDGLPPGVCDLVSELEQADALLVGGDVFHYDAVRLGQIFTDKRELLARIAERLTGDLQRRLSEQLLTQHAMDEAILERWDQQRGALAAQYDDGPWPPRILDESVRRPDGVKVEVDDFFGAAYSNFTELVIRCRAPELADGPREVTGEDPPPGRLMFVRRADGHDDAQEGRIELAMSDPRGGNVRRVADPAPWQVLAGLEAGRGGDHQVVVGARAGDEFGLVVVDDSGTVLHVAARGPEDLACASWNDAGDAILALANTSDVDERRLHLIDLTRRGTSRPLDLPFAVVGCSAFISEDRLVVADAAPSTDREPGVWTVGIDGSDPRQLYSPPGHCRTQVGSVNPTGTRVAVSQRCSDPTASGLWVVDLSNGEADHIVTAVTGPAKWSPDGTWLVFGLVHFIGDKTSTVWAAREDGRQLRQVTEGPSWTPVWLPLA